MCSSRKVKLTTEEIIELGWEIYKSWRQWHTHDPVKHFKRVMLDIDKKKPSPEKAAVQLYDYYIEYSHDYEHFAEEIRDELFDMCKITKPIQRGCCIRLFSDMSEIYEKESLKASIKELDYVINEMRTLPLEESKIVNRL